MVYSVGNQFGLNLTRQYPKGSPTVGSGRGDLRDKYSLTAQVNDFKSYLNQNGYSYQQYQQDKWDAQMMAQQQQQIANQEAITGTFSNLGGIISGIKGIFGL